MVLFVCQMKKQYRGEPKQKVRALALIVEDCKAELAASKVADLIDRTND